MKTLILGALFFSSASLAVADTAPVTASSHAYCAHRVVPAAVASTFPTQYRSPNMPHSLRGIWWVTDATGQTSGAISFASASWDENTKTITYQSQGNNIVPGEVAPGGKYSYGMEPYDVIQTRRVILADGTNGQGLKQTSDGHWEGPLSDQATYKLTRIVREDGTNEAAFGDYLAAMAGQSLEVLCESQAVNLKSASATINLPGGPDPVYVELGGATEHISYRLELAAPVAVNAVLYNPGGAVTNAVNPKELVMQVGFESTIVQLQSSTPVAVKLSLKTEDVPRLTDAADLQVVLQPGVETRVHVGLQSARSGLYQLIGDADFAFSLRTFGSEGYSDQKASNDAAQRPYIILPMDDGSSDDAELILTPRDGGSGTVELALRPAMTQDVDKGKIIVDGPAVEATLADVLTTDIYTIAVPSGVTITSKDSLYLYTSPLSGDPLCCVGARADGHSDAINYGRGIWPWEVLGSSRYELSPADSQDAQGGKVWVLYNGDRNALNPALHYKIELKKEPSSRPY